MKPGLSFNSTLLSKIPVQEVIRIAAEAGYEGIDISAETGGPPFLPLPPPHLTPEADASLRREVRNCAEQAGIPIVALNAHNSLIDPRPEKRRANIDYVKGALQLASDLGARHVVIGAGKKEFYGWESVYWDRFIQALRELLPVADSLGVTIAVEAASQPGVLIFGASGVHRLLSYDGLDSLGLLFDSAHFHIRGEDVARAFATFSDRIVHIHLKDARGQQENFECPPLGMGDVGFKGLLSAVREVDYQGFLSVEDESPGWGYEIEPRKALADARAFVDGLFETETGL